MCELDDFNAIETILARLTKEFGSRLSLNEEVLQAHGHDVSRHTTQAPQAVIYPVSTEDVSTAV